MQISKDKNEQQKLLNSLMKQLSPADEAKLQQILNDKDAQKKMLSTPQAQELMRQLFGDEQNSKKGG
ncbi:hypothetical protein [Hydrogeniiclostridium mannosilyticum]|uniref:hypothetical protein n=1 Tax=Hydrogeniiclostridium mannosilyticum TaxID=2764322 RepID=UPI0018A9DDBD|nr:hypothetical protein [Hydrogeniiclostridium mannosilyticum]